LERRVIAERRHAASMVQRSMANLHGVVKIKSVGNWVSTIDMVTRVDPAASRVRFIYVKDYLQ
jgi:hypothetical protein